ncbi:MAG: PAS domain S-box protein [Chloroflexi bacterium]|nr:PAS domain S-box protein [Chloroflexota bacterium]
MKSLFSRLTEPSPALTSSIQRQQARLLASLSLALLIAALVIIPVWVSASLVYPAVRWIGLGVLAMFVVIYGLSRTRWYIAGVVLHILTTWAVVLTTLAISPLPILERMVVVKFLANALFLSIYFLRLRVFIILAVLNLMVGGAFLFVPDVPLLYTFSLLVYFTVIPLLIGVGTLLSEAYKKRLEVSEARYRSVFAAMSEGVMLLGHGGKIVASNASAERILNVGREPVPKRSWASGDWQAIHEDGSAFAPEDYPAAMTMRTGQPYRDVIMGLLTEAGQTRWISINSQPLLKDGSVLPDEVVVSFTDITERRESEKALAEAQQREFEYALEKERVRLLSQFIEKASHEFRTPLAVINSLAFAMARTHEPEQRATQESKIKQQIKRMARLVDMLLHAYRLESGQTPSAEAAVALSVVIDAALDLAVQSVPFRPAIRCENVPPTVKVMANQSVLVESLRHIIDNALRFTPPDGLVTVRANVEDGQARIEIQDTGLGIAAADLPHIFETFWRQDEAHSTPGIGLGLPIARRIIMMYGGEIAATSELGKGSTFTITLPIVAGAG